MRERAAGVQAPLLIDQVLAEVLMLRSEIGFVLALEAISRGAEASAGTAEVGQASSPGTTSSVGTGLSSTPKMGLPSLPIQDEEKAHLRRVRPQPEIFLPFCTTSIRTGGDARS